VSRCRRGGPGARGRGLHHRLAGRAVPARRQAAGHRRRNQRNQAHADRPRADRRIRTWEGRLLKQILACATALAAIAAVPATAQEQARLNWVEVHSPHIEGNLEGNSAERKVLVVTPPGYDQNSGKRYPVVYYLHGYWAPVEAQQEGFKLHEAVQAAAEAGNEVIMVMPDGFSKLRGGFYSSSPTVGDYERFVADDLVDWVDANYRTIPERASRGLAGHSMGGYGTIRIAIKQPETFSTIYMMSACCLDPMPITAEQARQVEAMTPEQVAAAQFGELAAVSTLATWSPDPT